MTEQTEPKKTSLLAVALLALTFIVYVTSLNNGYIWDDDKYVTQNPLLAQPGGLQKIWLEPAASPQYYPLVFTTYWIEHRLWGIDHPAGFHGVNVLLHAITSVLIWRLLVRLNVAGAWMIAAVFAVHPVMVESVAWITERKNTLSMLFYVLTLHCWMRFCPVDEDRSERERHWGWYALAVACFFAALLAKTVVCTLPAAVALLILWKRSRLGKRDVMSLAPFFIFGIAMGLNTAMIERDHVGATGTEWSMGVFDRFLVAGNAVVFYACKLAVPRDLTFVYPRWDIAGRNPALFIAPIIVLAVTVGLFLTRKRIGVGPLAAWLFFIGTLFPALGFFNVYPFRYSFVADHFQYHASVGFIALVIGSAAFMFNRAFHDRAKHVPVMLGVVTLLALGITTARQTPVYRDLPTLWLDTIAKNPDAFIAHNNLGLIYLEQKNLPAACERFIDAVRLSPNVIEARMNLGTVLLDLDRPSLAAGEFDAAIGIDRRRAEPFLMLGRAQRRLGRLDDAKRTEAEALAMYEKVVVQNGNNPMSLYGLGRAQLYAGRFDDAIKTLGMLSPMVPAGERDMRSELVCLIAMAHQAAGREAEAVPMLLASHQKMPQLELSLRLALALAASTDDKARNGQTAEALARGLCEWVGGKSPYYPRCLRALAAAYAEMGDFDRAEKAATAGAGLARQAQGETLPGTLESDASLYREHKPLRISGVDWVW